MSGAATDALGVVFDLDGLLVDTEPLWRESSARLLARRGLEPDLSLRPRLMGRHPLEVATITIEHFGLDDAPDALVDERLQLMRELYAERSIEPLPGARELVAELAEAEVPMAVASGSPTWLVGEVISRLSLPIALHVGSDKVENGKPAPDTFLLAARTLELSPSCCVALEDSPLGVRSALAAGMCCVAVPGAETARDAVAGAHLVIASLAEVDLGRLLALSEAHRDAAPGARGAKNSVISDA